MQTTTLLLNLKSNEIVALLTLCRRVNRADLADLCESKEQIAALNAALDEIAWQLASSGHEDALKMMTEREGGFLR